MVRGAGFEPAKALSHRILSPTPLAWLGNPRKKFISSRQIKILTLDSLHDRKMRRRKATDSVQILIKPLALRYLYRAYKELDPKLFDRLLAEAVRIAHEEGHGELRANTVRKALARLSGKDLKTVCRVFFPLRLRPSEARTFSLFIKERIKSLKA
jgi:hypothetical protein